MLRNGWHPLNKSAVLSRKFLSLPTSRIGSSTSAVVLTNSFADPDKLHATNGVKESKYGRNDGVENIKYGSSFAGTDGTECLSGSISPSESISTSDGDYSADNGMSTDDTLTTKQKRHQLVCNSPECINDWSTEELINYIDTDLSFAMLQANEVNKKAAKVKRVMVPSVLGPQKTNAIESCSTFGRWNGGDIQALASLKNGPTTPSSVLSEGSEDNDKILSDCSEEEEDALLANGLCKKMLKCEFRDVSLETSEALEQRSSLTDSSGIESSSDADGDHPSFSNECVENGLRDVTYDGFNDRRDKYHNLPEILMDAAVVQEADFKVVERKRKSKTSFLPTDSNSVFNSGRTFKKHVTDNVTSAPAAYHAAYNETSESLGNDHLCNGFVPSAETCKEMSGCTASALASALGPAEFQPNDSSGTHSVLKSNVSVDSENFLAGKRISDVRSISLDEASSAADFELPTRFSEPTTPDGDWMVVRTGRRSKISAQQSFTADQTEKSRFDDAKQTSQTNTSQPLGNSVRYNRNTGRWRGKASSSRPPYGERCAPVSHCDISNGSNNRFFDRSRHDTASKSRQQESNRNAVSCSAATKANFVNESSFRNKTRVETCGSSSRKNLESAKCDQNSSVKSEVSCVRPAVISDGNPKLSSADNVCLDRKPAGNIGINIEDLSVSGSRTPVSSENENTESPLSLVSALNTPDVIRFNESGFDLIGCQIFVYKAFEEVLADRKRNSHLVVTYDPEREPLCHQ